MKTSRTHLPIRFAFLLFASSLSCRQTATEPTVLRIPPTQPILNLAGSWTGAITFGSDYRKPCAPSEAIVAQVIQQGQEVDSSFPTSCEGMLRFRGALSGTFVAAELFREDGSLIGKLKGHASSTRISLENRDGDPWGYGDPTIGLSLQR